MSMHDVCRKALLSSRSLFVAFLDKGGMELCAEGVAAESDRVWLRNCIAELVRRAPDGIGSAVDRREFGALTNSGQLTHGLQVLFVSVSGRALVALFDARTSGGLVRMRLTEAAAALMDY